MAAIIDAVKSTIAENFGGPTEVKVLEIHISEFQDGTRLGCCFSFSTSMLWLREVMLTSPEATTLAMKGTNSHSLRH